MTDLKLLQEYVTDSGMTKTKIAQKAGMTRDRLYSILRGNECKASEIEGLAKTLRLTNAIRDRIFFAKEVAK